jgi:hypothetical protein
MERASVNEGDLVPMFSQPDSISSRPAADVQDHSRRGGKETLEQRLRARQLERASSSVEPVALQSPPVVGSNLVVVSWVHSHAVPRLRKRRRYLALKLTDL